MDPLLPSQKFEKFTVVDVDYKRVRDVPIKASILIPKYIKPGVHPVTIRWHGGFLVTGHRLFEDWYPNFILEFCLKHSAIAITPDYRLMPEATGVDILNDLRDFFEWLQVPGNLAAHLPPGISVDLQNILVTGESAGGWLAWQSGRLYPQIVSAIIAHYPMLELDSPHFCEAYEKQLFDPPAPQLPPQILSKFLEGLNGDEVVVNAIPPSRVPFVLSILQQGRLMEFLGAESELFPMRLLSDAQVSNSVPPTWILHGQRDSVVPLAGTTKYLEALRRYKPDAALHVSLQPGEHGFDNHQDGSGEPATLETDWVKDGVAFVEKYWPM